MGDVSSFPSWLSYTNSLPSIGAPQSLTAALPWQKNFSDDEDVNWSPLAHEITFTSSNSDMNSQPLGEFPYRTYHSITIKELDSLPSNHHYFLVDPMIPGFALLDKTWKLFNVEWLEELKETNSMDILVIDEVNRNIVEAVCRSQSQPWKIDSISNKGEGQVALLHGMYFSYPPPYALYYLVTVVEMCFDCKSFAEVSSPLRAANQNQN